MKIPTPHKSFFAALAVLMVAWVGLAAPSAHAQSDTTKIAVLDVPGGGTDKLFAALEQLDDVELEDQQWFLKQIQARGFKPKGIMKRSDDIKWLMDGADLDYILYMAAVDDSSYKARIVGNKGSEVHNFPVDRNAEEGISSAGARMIRQELREFLAEEKGQEEEEEEEEESKPNVTQLDESDDDNDPNERRKKAAAEKSAAQEKMSRDWLTVMGRFSLLQRSFQVGGERLEGGSEKALLSYGSVFYPGFALSVEAFPLGASNVEMAHVGFYGDYTQGFDSVVVDNETGEAAAISHMQLEGGVLYMLGDAVALKDSDEAKMSLGVGVRHGNYSVEENPSLPSTSHTSVVLGVRVNRPAFTENFEVRAGAEVMPIGMYGNGEELFGESSQTFGFGAQLGGTYQATEKIGLVLDYEFDLQRTLFEGEGEADFVEAGAFELVQGLTAGLFYRY
ncbi:MAG: hypothetical protein ACLFVJ_16530 [Persicimonas sp.]